MQKALQKSRFISDEEDLASSHLAIGHLPRMTNTALWAAEVRRDARHLSERQLAIGEIAFLLGLSEPSAFHRAFKRWTGLAPLTYSEIARAGPEMISIGH